MVYAQGDGPETPYTVYSSVKGPCNLMPYVSPTGRSPVLEFLAELRRTDNECYLRLRYTLDRLRELGTDLGTPHWVRLGRGLGEIRSRCRRMRFRIYCSEEADSTVVMYEAVKKMWRQFSDADRDLCEKRRAEFRSADYDQEARMYHYKARNKPHV